MAQRPGIVCLNTVMLQDVLAEQKWSDLLQARRPARPDPAVLEPHPPLR
jgi:hypothetical protein